MHALPLLLGLVACGGGSAGKGPAGSQGSGTATGTPADPQAVADVTAVSVSGDVGAYDFAVTIRSDETGCDQYADWWEVLTPEGELLYRRILNHSHPSEQPFTRSGGPVLAQPGDSLVVRAHLHPNGYVGAVLVGTIEGGFQESTSDPDLAPGLATEAPLPESCWF